MPQVKESEGRNRIEGRMGGAAAGTGSGGGEGGSAQVGSGGKVAQRSVDASGEGASGVQRRCCRAEEGEGGRNKAEGAGRKAYDEATIAVRKLSRWSGSGWTTSAV